MSTRIRDHLRSNAVGYVALFCFAIGGTAYATHPGGQNTISSTDIINGEVRNDDLAADSVGSGKIADRQVKNADLSIGASSSNTIADGGIQGVDVRNETLTTEKLADLAVTIPKLAFDPATQSELNAHKNSGDHDEQYWTLQGNEGIVPSRQFLGTLDDAPLELRVNAASALRLEPASDGTNQSPNVIGGIADNFVTAGVHSATIAGGGRNVATNAATANRVTDDKGTVGGGANNQAGDGAGTTIDGQSATVGGGISNAASGPRATVGGGGGNDASGDEATVPGGFGNLASGLQAAVGGGFSNTASGTQATVAGGNSNTASGDVAIVGGGDDNTASGRESTVGGGIANSASGEEATLGGGRSNVASGQGGTLAGGVLNDTTGTEATVGGGGGNTASGLAATVPGGGSNTADGNFSLAAGRRAKANHSGAFVWADSTNLDMASTAVNQFIARASGDFFLQSDSTLDDQGGFLNTSTGGFLSTGGAWTNASDENLKSGFERVGPRGVLAQVAELPVRSWHYDVEPAVSHIGPTAQDFRAAFGLGADNRHIASVDADGVALAAIKGLDKEVTSLQRKLRAEHRRRIELRHQTARLQRRLVTLEQHGR